MKLIVEKQGEFIEAIKAEYTPAEMILLRYAMHRFVKDEDVNETDRAIMKQMLFICTGESEESQE